MKMTSEEVLVQHKDMIWWMIHKLNVPSSTTKEDLFQAASEAILVNAHKYDPERGALSTFLHYIIRGALRREIQRSTWVGFRTDGPAKYVRDDRAIGSLDALASWEPSADTYESDQELSVYLDSLPERNRFIVEAAMAGFTNVEIGEMLGITRERVRQVLLDSGEILGLAGTAKAVKSDRECIHGHELTPENTYHNPSNGQRVCRMCMSIAQAKWRAKKKKLAV